jgi:hypothetical protein
MKSRLMFLVALSVAIAPAVARAQGLSGASDTNFTGFTCSGGGGDGDCQRAAGFTVNNSNTFTSRYAWNVSADTGVGSTHDTSSNAQHNISFNATAPGGYRLDITTSRVGALGRSSDASGCSGSADTTGVTGTASPALSSGTINLGDPGVINPGGGDTNTPYSLNNSGNPGVIFRVSNGVALSHTLTFTWSGSARSNSCEASVREGAGSGSTSGCNICGYPGSFSRTQSTDGQFVTVAFTSLCGNGNVDSSVGEDCEPPNSGCCGSNCKFLPSGTQCRGPAGECDQAENCTGTSATCPADVKKPLGTACTADSNPCTLDQCDGSSAACQHPAGNAGAVCRASAGVCDVAETCTGASTSCPADGFASSSTPCRAAAGECDQVDNCTGGSALCPADAKKPNGTACTDDGNVCTTDTCNGSSDTCQHPAGNAGTVCRASAGICDVAETCNGSSPSCPADGFASSSTPCRAAAGECDQVDNCTGGSALCPADAKKPNGTACTDDGNACSLDQCDGTNNACQHPAGNAGATCRASAGDCDVAETCDGASTTCPADQFKSSATECRASAGDCDVAENCTGSSATCPADQFKSSATECRGSAGVCDIAENCTGSSATCPADAREPATTVCRGSGGICDIVENCDGTNVACPADQVEPSSTQCRASAGDCDVADNCDGTNKACPADQFKPSSTECRASAGICDLAENCTGSSATCPSDSFKPSSTECRGVADVCDLAENCTGSSAACPADGFKTSGVCRPASDLCDAVESCNGSGPACPPDGVEPATKVCRAAADFCDLAEFCDGSTMVCPADVHKPDYDGDTVCDEIDNCGILPNPGQEDGDGDGVGDECDNCTNLANTFISTPRLYIGNLTQPAGKRKTTFSGSCVQPLLPPIDLVTHGLRFVVQDALGDTVMDHTLAPGVWNPATRTGWRANPRGWTYKTTNYALNGGLYTVVVSLRPNAPNALKFRIKGKNGSYAVTPNQIPLMVSMIMEPPSGASVGQCCSSQFLPRECRFDNIGKTLTCRPPAR